MSNPFQSDWSRGVVARHRGKLFIAQAVGFVLIGILITSALWRSPAKENLQSRELSMTPAEMVETLWTCSMHPQVRLPMPGKCPICGMDLIPVATSAGAMRTLSISAESKGLMNIETSPVERRYVMHEILMVGRVDYDETTLGYITAWVPGRLDRLFVDFTGIQVKKGDHLASIYSE